MKPLRRILCRVFLAASNVECGRPIAEHCGKVSSPQHEMRCSLAHHWFSSSRGPSPAANRSVVLLLAAAPAAGSHNWILGLVLVFATLSVIVSALAWLEAREGRQHHEERRSLRIRRDEIRQHTEEVLP